MKGDSKNRLKKAYYGSLSSAIYQIVALICSFVVPRLILQTYGSTYNGIVSSITQFLGFYSILQVGIQGATRVSLYRAIAAEDKNKVDSIMVANIGYYEKIAKILLVYTLCLSLFFAITFENDISRIEIVLLVFIIGAREFIQYYYGNVYKAFITAIQEEYILNIIQLVTVLLNAVFYSIAMIMGARITIAVLISSLVYMLNPLCVYVYVQRKYKINMQAEPDPAALKSRWDVFANSFANIVHQNIDIIVITLCSTAKEISVFSVYNFIGYGLTRIITVFTNGTEGAFGDMFAHNENEKVVENFNKYEFIIYSITLVLTVCTLNLIIPFVSLYTQNINDTNYIRPYLGLAIAISFASMSLRTPYVTIVQAAGHYSQTKNGSILEAVINLFATIILVNYCGIIGAVVGTIIANTFRTIQYGVYVSKHLVYRNVSALFLRITWFIFTLLLSYLLCGYLLDVVEINSWMVWCVAGVVMFTISIVIYICSSLLFYRRDFMICWKSIIKTIYNGRRR